MVAHTFIFTVDLVTQLPHKTNRKTHKRKRKPNYRGTAAGEPENDITEGGNSQVSPQEPLKPHKNIQEI